MYSQAVIIAKYTLTESLEQGLFYNNDQLTTLFLLYINSGIEQNINISFNTLYIKYVRKSPILTSFTTSIVILPNVFILDDLIQSTLCWCSKSHIFSLCALIIHIISIFKHDLNIELPWCIKQDQHRLIFCLALFFNFHTHSPSFSLSLSLSLSLSHTHSDSVSIGFKMRPPCKVSCQFSCQCSKSFMLSQEGIHLVKAHAGQSSKHLWYGYDEYGVSALSRLYENLAVLTVLASVYMAQGHWLRWAQILAVLPELWELKWDATVWISF